MPRQARIDAPGLVYHIMARGIERRKIFLDDADRADFCRRMAVWINKTGARCMAWCLMPNHFHFVLRRGERPVSELMHRVMTGYAVNFNLRHSRAGHLFQNRYKSVICGLEEYFLELVPYIHLNPLRAKLVKDLGELEEYPWCGHNCVVTGWADELLDRRALLEHFGAEEKGAVRNYIQKMRERAAEVEQGGIPGRLAFLRNFRIGVKVPADKRTLGDDGGAGQAVLVDAGEKVPLKKSREEVLDEAGRVTGTAPADILRRTRERGPARGRAIYCHLAREEAGSSIVELSRELGITESAVSKLALRGRQLACGCK